MVAVRDLPVLASGMSNPNKIQAAALSLVVSVSLLAACGGGAGSGGGGSDRGGPDSLIGFQWTADPITVNGITFEFGFEFSADTVTAYNTCDGALTATVEAPVRYLYTATVPAGDSTEAASDGNTCRVSIDSGTFDFEIVDGKLRMTQNGETLDFEPAGATAGLYGEWTADAPGIGTLIWSMGGGQIVATTDCDNGLSATVEVDADFINRLEFPEPAEDVVTEGTLECSVSVAATMMTYYFDGDTLVMSDGGEEIRFEPR